MSTQITATGNLTADPELIATQTGTTMVTFSIAETTRKPDGNGGFVDGVTSFYRVRSFNGLASNVLASLHKGDRVLVEGNLEIVRREGKTGEGVDTVFTDASILANDVAPSLRFSKVEGSMVKTVGPRAQASKPAEEAAPPAAYLDDEAPATEPVAS
jgi:single-strand DNA-binding protein